VMLDRLTVERIDFVGPRADYNRLVALLGRVDRVEVKRLRVIITDGPVADDQVDDVIAALKRRRG
jgi:hypothetical protein